MKKLLYNKEIDTLLDCIEAQINSVSDKDEIAGLRELQRYYTENKDALLGYYDRGIPIPETRAPGVVRVFITDSIKKPPDTDSTKNNVIAR